MTSRSKQLVCKNRYLEGKRKMREPLLDEDELKNGCKLFLLTIWSLLSVRVCPVPKVCWEWEH